MNRPLVEVELAFVLREPLRRPQRATPPMSSGPPTSCCPCMEIVDTRQKGRGPNAARRQHLRRRRLRPGGAGRPAEPAYRHRHPPGRRQPVDQRHVEESGVASAVMGNPINSVAWLANKLHEYGVTPRPATSSCRARSSRPSRSSRATPSWRCSTRSAKSPSTPSRQPMRYGVSLSHPDLGNDPGFLKDFAQSVEGAGLRPPLSPPSTSSAATPIGLAGEKVHTADVPLPRAVRPVRLPRRGHRAHRAGHQHPDPAAAPDGARGQAGGRARPAHRRTPRLGVGVGPQLDGVRGPERGLRQPRRAHRGAGRGAAAALDRGAGDLRRAVAPPRPHRAQPDARAAAHPDLDGLVRSARSSRR